MVDVRLAESGRRLWRVQLGLRSADRKQAEQSLGADLSVDPERHGRGKKDAHAGCGYRRGNLDVNLPIVVRVEALFARTGREGGCRGSIYKGFGCTLGAGSVLMG